MTRTRPHPARQRRPGYRWWIQAAAVPVVVACIAAGSAIITARTSPTPLTTTDCAA